MTLKSSIQITLLVATTISVFGQVQVDTVRAVQEYRSIEAALKNPEKVYRLDLSNQDINVSSDVWSKFTSLEYLSLRNDHLIEIPEEIGLLPNLKTLDLSGNDFVALPKTFRNLSNLEEIFLNDEKRFVLNKNIFILKDLPKLRIIHLENDSLRSLPRSFSKLNQVESLYLNNNKFVDIPKPVKRLKNLRFVNLQENNLMPENRHLQNPGFGFKVVF